MNMQEGLDEIIRIAEVLKDSYKDLESRVEDLETYHEENYSGIEIDEKVGSLIKMLRDRGVLPSEEEEEKERLRKKALEKEADLKARIEDCKQAKIEGGTSTWSIPLVEEAKG